MPEPNMSELLPPEALESINPVETVLNKINGHKIEQELLELAKIGGSIQEIGKNVAVTRLTLSKEDTAARDLLKRQMEEAGMQTEQHPMGLIGVYPGKDQNLPAVMLLSHFDSVPNGGAYDGTVGVMSGIETISALHKNHVITDRSIIVLALTGEESSRFNVALMGSKAFFRGLSDEELDNRRPGDQSLREALIENGFNPEEVKKPRFKPEEISACVELHVSQNRSLEQRSKDLAIIEAIAAPDRRELTIGDPIEPDTQEPANAQYFAVSVQGRADHSGATPMGVGNRLDSLRDFTAPLVWGINQKLQELKDNGNDISVSIGTLTIENQSLNKIPGNVTFNIRIGGGDTNAIKSILALIKSHKAILGLNHKFFPDEKQQLVNVEELKQPPAEEFFKSEDIMPRQKFAMEVIQTITDVAHTHQSLAERNVVGTVGTYTLNGKGQIVLGMDIRGTDAKDRENAIEEMLSQIEWHNQILNKGIIYNVRKLPGSSEPTQMDKSLVALAEKVIRENNLGSYETTFSPAGHDTQNAARIGIPTVMIFIPSRNNGASHTPQEYSTPEDLKRGATALAALTIELASKNN